MKSFSAIAVLLFVCVFALVQVWAAPVEEAAADTSVADVSAHEQAVKDWYASTYQQYAQPALV